MAEPFVLSRPKLPIADPPTVARLLADSADLRDLARRLGQVCLDHGRAVDSQLAEMPEANEHVAAVEEAIAAVRLEEIEEAERSASTGLTDLSAQPALSGPVAAALEALPPLAQMAVLKGLCRGPLDSWFIQCRTRIELDRGDPFPLCQRPRPATFVDLTPHASTLNTGHLLANTRFRLFDFAADPGIYCAIDFTHADVIDDATWGSDDRFPIVATVHPYSSVQELRIARHDQTCFFGVGPRNWDEAAVSQLLEQAADAPCAVLPELSLPDPDALGPVISRRHESFSRLLIAGSAHVAHENDRFRSNESVVYLDGVEILRHRKIHGFKTKSLAPDLQFDDPVQEDLKADRKELTVVSGQRTRLAVVICADLNDSTIPMLLAQLGVNVLLVPSLSGFLGSFNGAAAQLASQCQGFTVIVNGSPQVESGSSDDTFMVLAGAPSSVPDQQTHRWGPPRSGRSAVGRLDLNASPLAKALTWS